MIIMKERISILRWVIGRWRLFWRLCPECNSDAPEVDTCDVCLSDRNSFYLWNHGIKIIWWEKYVMKHNKIKNNALQK